MKAQLVLLLLSNVGNKTTDVPRFPTSYHKSDNVHERFRQVLHVLDDEKDLSVGMNHF
jgi:hypothetical protein